MKMTQNIYQYILGTLLVLALLFLLYFLFTKDIPDANRNLLSLLVGALIGSVTTIVQYYFGSSKGSSDKDELLRKGKE
jgi:drug/metabolite transporter (DMT)-like permease